LNSDIRICMRIRVAEWKVHLITWRVILLFIKSLLYFYLAMFALKI